MRCKNSLIRLPFLGLACISWLVNGQNVVQYQVGNHFDMSVMTEFGITDNFLYEKSNEQSTSFWQVAPRLYLQTQTDNQLFSINTQFNHFKFSKFSQDDHSNVKIEPRYLLKFSEDKTLFIKGKLHSHYEYRGTGLSLGDAESLNQGDEKENSNFSAGYVYGVTESVAKLQFEAGLQSNKYNSRRDITRLLDQEERYIKLSFDYLFGSGSYLATNFIYQTIEFEHQPEQDKTKSTALLGIKWNKSTITQFNMLLGYQEIVFNNSQIADDDGFKWRIDANWHPVDSMLITMKSERSFDEANRLSNSYRLADSHSIKIHKQFSDFIDFSADMIFNQEQIIYTDNETTENYLTGILQVDYNPNDWLSVYLRYHYSDLDASELNLGYEKNSLLIGFSVNI